jgi:phosphoglycolate phosphatase
MPGNVRDLNESLRSSDVPLLLLFDIDGTLIDTGGKGMSALRKTAIEIFGNEGPPLDLAGSTDLGILEKLHAHFDTAPCAERTYRFFETYHIHLENSLSSNPSEGRVIDGVVELLKEITGAPHTKPALLTGNTMQGAWIKLRHYRLDHYFSFGAYGSDLADRNHLGRIALERALAHTGQAYGLQHTLVIGDTPKDIACAHAVGAKCLAVATGHFSEDQLAAAGADWVVSSLREISLR